MRALWSFNNCLTPDECKSICLYADTLPSQEGTVTQTNIVNKDKRSSTIKWINRKDSNATWCFEKIDEVVWRMNRYYHGIDYDKDGVDSMQYTEYEEGDYYNAHIDTFFNAGDLVQRKVSSTVLLSDPKDFEGGKLFIEGGTMEDEKISQGQIYVFPSILNHWVAPITKGKRKSLVLWHTGRAWK